MNIFFKLVLLFAFSSALVSCGGLHKAQIAATQDFARVTGSIAQLPPQIYQRIYTLKSSSQYLQLSSLMATDINTKESVDALTAQMAEDKAADNSIKAFAAAYNVVAQYASLVLALTSKTELEKLNANKANWQPRFELMVTRYNSVSQRKIPANVGSLTAQIIRKIGVLKIHRLQEKYLKEAIQKSSKPFIEICTDFIEVASVKLAGEMQNLPEQLDNNFANFLENVRGRDADGSNPYPIYTQYIPIYVNSKLEAKSLISSSQKTVEAFKKLRDGFIALEAYIQMDNPGLPPPIIDELIMDYQDIVQEKNFTSLQLPLKN